MSLAKENPSPVEVNAAFSQSGSTVVKKSVFSKFAARVEDAYQFYFGFTSNSRPNLSEALAERIHKVLEQW
jgi:hypothetical protein